MQLPVIVADFNRLNLHELYEIQTSPFERLQLCFTCMMYWPGHVYIPGKNQRHDAGAFDVVCSSIHASMSVEELTQSAAFQHGLQYLEHGYYWEAHEVLEPVWMALSRDSEERYFVQALIQVANAHLKHLMGRKKAALRLCSICRELFDRTESPEVMGVSKSKPCAMLDELELNLQ